MSGGEGSDVCATAQRDGRRGWGRAGHERALPAAVRYLLGRGAAEGRAGRGGERASRSSECPWNSSGGHPQGGPGPEYLHLLDRIRHENDGGCAAILHREQCSKLLLNIEEVEGVRLPGERRKKDIQTSRDLGLLLPANFVDPW